MSKESDFVDFLNKEIYELKIADLEAKLSESEKALEAKESVNQMYKATLSLKDSDFSDLVRENAQLKQQLHDLPKNIVCEISEAIERLSWRKRIYTNWEFDKEQLYKDLDTILKKYGGENE